MSARQAHPATGTRPVMPDAPPHLVFLPGLAGSAGEFTAQRAHFEQHRPALALDPLTSGDLGVTGQADQLAELVRRQQLGPVVVVGHSHGGVVALAMSTRHPDVVAGLVVLDAPLLLPRVARAAARVPLAMLRTRLALPLLRRFFTATFTEGDSASWRGEVLQRLELVPRRVAHAAAHGTFTYDTTAAINAVTVPALVVRANIPLDAARLPGHVRYGEVTGTGHWPHVHAPDAVNELLEQFLSPLRMPREPEMGAHLVPRATT